MTHHKDDPLQIAGAGPAGLAAAIILAKANYRVVVHDAQQEVGYRFQGDLQGIENWSRKEDALDELCRLGITTDFNYFPCKLGNGFDAWGHEYPLSSDEPFYYMVERGPASGSFDRALLKQAQSLGVEVRFNSRIHHIDGPGVLATGPRTADAISVGYHFDTDMKNGFWVICDNSLAPKGYAYLLVMNGRGTVKSCMYTDFKQEQVYVQRTVAAFKKLVGLQMSNPAFHGGVANFFLPDTAMSDELPMVGELAGFQDSLWGFGIRTAITSGILAAQSIINGTDYDEQWHNELARLMKTSIVNRFIFGSLGNNGYRWFLKYIQQQPDIRLFLFKQYHPSLWKNLIFPFVKIKYKNRH